MRINIQLRRTAEDIVEIGKDLIAVKESLPHGCFLPWIEAEFGMSQWAARNFMKFATTYGDNSGIIHDLSPTALYALAAPKTPIEVQEEIERRIEALQRALIATIKGSVEPDDAA